MGRIFSISIKEVFQTTVLVLLIGTVSFGQVDFTRNQLGINASKFVLIFDEQVNNLDLFYRVSIDSTYGLRASVSLDVSSAEDAVNDFSGRIGIDKIFLQKGSWKFYTGIDVNYSVNTIKSSQRTNRKYGGMLFLGFMRHFGPHFSISTEPSLAFFHNTTQDKTTFNPDVNTSSNTLELINLGQIRVSFHF